MTFRKFLLSALILGCSAATFSPAAMKRSGSLDSFDDAYYPHASGSGVPVGSDGTRAPSPLPDDLLRDLQNDLPRGFSGEEVDEEDDYPRPLSVSSDDSWPYSTQVFQKYGYRQYDTSRSNDVDVYGPIFPPRAKYLPKAADFAIYAVQIGDLENLRYIISEEGLEILSQPSEDGSTPGLYVPAHRHILEYVAQNAPATLEHVGRYLLTPAFMAPDLWTLQYLVAHAPSGVHILDARSCSGETLAHKFADRLDIIQYLLENAPSGRQLLMVKDSTKKTPLAAALRHKNRSLAVIQYMVANAPNGAASLEHISIPRGDLDLLIYMASLPNYRKFSFSEGSLAAMRYGDAEEELRILQEGVGMLYASAVGLTPAQKTALKEGKPVVLTDAQQARAAQVQSHVPFVALREAVVPMTQKIAQTFKTDIPEAIIRQGQQWDQMMARLAAQADLRLANAQAQANVQVQPIAPPAAAQTNPPVQPVAPQARAASTSPSSEQSIPSRASSTASSSSYTSRESQPSPRAHLARAASTSSIQSMQSQSSRLASVVSWDSLASAPDVAPADAPLPRVGSVSSISSLLSADSH